MTTQQQIEKILNERYGGADSHSLTMRKLFRIIRDMEKPLTLWQVVKMLFGIKVIREKITSDEDFLTYLLQLEKILEKPKYKQPESSPMEHEIKLNS